jgi:hypothetical protein
MPLKQLWEKTPDIVLQYNIKQIVSAAGKGVLTDGSECSSELRDYFRSIPEPKLFQYVNSCVDNRFDKSGFVLQDLVNEIGHRLDYIVENGLYQGRQNKIGFDGIWEAPNNHAIIIEVKTTDVYRINLDSIALYRSKLIESHRITKYSSILIVVARQDTGDLEAQIRGSRHAWDIRVISVDALTKLLKLKINSDEEETTTKIRSILIPFEYTRLDNIVDVIFTAAKDVETGSEGASEGKEIASPPGGEVRQERTPREILDKVTNEALAALGKKENVHLIAYKRLLYWNSDRNVRAVCPFSKQYPNGEFWYGFRPRHKEFLKDCERGYLILCCLNHPYAYAIPYREIEQLLPSLYMTEEGHYWHINIFPDERGEYYLKPKQGNNFYLKPFRLETKT